MRRKIFITLRDPEATALLDLAQREYRDPRQQAALLIADALRRIGALRPHPPDPGYPASLSPEAGDAAHCRDAAVESDRTGADHAAP
jgi:hypothetical protein